MNKNISVDNFHLSTRELLAAYGVSTRKELELSHKLLIKRKSKRVGVKVIKVYYTVSTVDKGQACERSESHAEREHSLKDFSERIRVALSMLYAEELLRVNLQEFGYSYDIVIGDYNLVVSYNRTYSTNELRPIMDLHKDHEIQHGMNFTGDIVQFNSQGKLVSDLGKSKFYVARVDSGEEDKFIYQMLIDLSKQTSERQLYLSQLPHPQGVGLEETQVRVSNLSKR